jgi:hypothetical protein
MSSQRKPPPRRTLRRALEALFREARTLDRRRRRRYALLALLGCAVAGIVLAYIDRGGDGASRALAQSRPPEPLPRLAGPGLTGPTRLRVVVAESKPPFILDVDHGTVRPVVGLGLGPRTSEWSPGANLLAAVPGGVLTAVWHNACQHCAAYSVIYLIRPDGSVRRLARVVGAVGPVPVAARGVAAVWVLNRARGGACTLALVPSRQPGVRVPCGRVQAQTQAGVWIATANRELIVNPITGSIVASVALTPANAANVATTDIYPLDGSLALESVGPQYGAQPDGGPLDRLSVVDLRSGRRRRVPWPSYFGGIIHVTPQLNGALVAVDFGSPAYPGPAQAEDIWILDTNTSSFTHIPGYPAQVSIKFSDLAWTTDNHLVIIAHGGGRAVLGIWKPGRTTLPLRSLPARTGYYGFVLLSP